MLVFSRMSTIKTASVLVALAGLAVLAPPARAEGPFEGQIALRLQDTAPPSATYFIRGEEVAVDVPSIAHAHDVHVVFNLARTAPLGADSAFVVVEKTGKRRAVVGQACEEWTLAAAGRTVHACVAPGIPWVDPRRATGTGDVPAWSRRLEKERAFPVSVTEGDHASWATDVTRGPVPESEFTVHRTARKP
jgi:hypothetical protein